MPNYRFIKDAYYGAGGFADGGYLVKFDRETDNNYLKRRKMAYYINYFKDIVDSLVNPVFKKKPARTYDGMGKEYIDSFLDNVDNTGTAINNFMKNAALKSKLLGAVFICVDNFPKIPGDMQTAIENRLFPYAYMIEPEFVTDYSVDNFGRLTALTYEESIQSGEHTTITRRVIFNDKTITTTINGQTVTQTEHGLGRIPVIYFPAVSFSGRQTLKPIPPLEAAAGVAKAIYNFQSFSGEILRKQTFPILVMPSTDRQSLDLGVSNALAYDPNATGGARPDFIAPPSSPADVLMNERHFLVSELYRMNGLSFVMESSAQASGVSRQWEFERTNQTLASFADQCRQAEMALLNLFQKWLHIDCSYNVQYADDFGIVDVASEIAEAQALSDLNLAPGLRIEILKKLLAVYLPDLAPDRYDEIIGEAEEAERNLAAAQAAQLESVMNGNGEGQGEGNSEGGEE